MAKPAAKKKGRRVRKGVAPGRGGAAPGTGRQPAFVATDEQRNAVMALVSIGTTHRAICSVLRIPHRTLERHFRAELQEGKEIIHAHIGGRIVREALGGDKTMMIYYSKTQMGWRERHSHGFEDAKGQPVSAENLFTVNIT